MKATHIFDVLLVSSGITTSAVLATPGADIGGGFTIPSTVIGPILVCAFTLIAFFLKQYYTAMVNVMTRQNTELKSINDKLSLFDRRMAVVESQLGRRE